MGVYREEAVAGPRDLHRDLHSRPSGPRARIPPFRLMLWGSAISGMDTTRAASRVARMSHSATPLRFSSISFSYFLNFIYFFTILSKAFTPLHLEQIHVIFDGILTN